MKVNLNFAQHIDVIEFEPFMRENIDDYKEAFNKWFYDKKDMELGIAFMPKDRFFNRPMDTNLIIEWLNDLCPECKAHVVMQKVTLGEEESNLPFMFF